MAKNNNGIKFRLIHLILTLVVILVTVVTAWVWQQAEARATAKAVEVIDVEGCKPIAPLRLDVELIKKDIGGMKDDMSEMRKEQKTGFKEILRRLPE